MRIFHNLPPFPHRHAPGTHDGFMPHMSRVFSWAALATVLAGCEGSGSVTHSAHLDARPDLQCMERAMQKLPGISQVRYLHAETANKQPFDEITYQADEEHIMLMVEPDHTYKQVFLRMGTRAADPLVGNIRRVMTRVDHTLAQRCHIPQLAHDVRESCSDTTETAGACPPLAP